MRKAKWLAVAALGIAASSCDLAAAATLEVQMTHLRPTRTVKVSVFRDADSWTRGAPVATKEVHAIDPSQSVRIDDLPAGRYAVRVDQEPNDSSLEMPNFCLERHGYSGRASSWMRPSFDHAAVEVGESGASIPVHLFTAERR